MKDENTFRYWFMLQILDRVQKVSVKEIVESEIHKLTFPLLTFLSSDVCHFWHLTFQVILILAVPISSRILRYKISIVKQQTNKQTKKPVPISIIANFKFWLHIRSKALQCLNSDYLDNCFCLLGLFQWVFRTAPNIKW